MNFKNKELAINSTCIVVSTAIIATILHELAHYVTALYFHLQPELHHNYVRTFASGTEQQQVLRAAAGPLFSLLLGICATLFSLKLSRPSLLKLFFLWLGMGSILMFLGYLLIAPIAKKGDTGKVFDYLGLPMWASISIAVLAFVFINYLFGKFSREFRFYKHAATFDIRENKKQLLLIPILSSIVIVTLLNLPMVTWVSLLPTVFMPMTYFSTLSAYKKLRITDADLVVDKVSYALLGLTVVSIVVFRLLV